MGRKTIDIKFLVEKANFALNSDFTQDEKRGIATFLETALHASGNYKGFRYLNMYKAGDGYKWPNEWDREYFFSKYLKEIK